MNLTATIEGIQYQPFLYNDLVVFDIASFNVNSVKASCVVRHDVNEFAISKWVSPKRTRSYPYARVYDTITRNKRATVIPVVKDEGLSGDRDFIQWDTISLMSLLEVYTIFGYYKQASKHPRRANKITSQRFDNDSIVKKLEELSTYQSSALHWNLKEIRETLPELIQKQEEAYLRISRETGVQLKSFLAYQEFRERLQQDVDAFMESSRRKAEQAQAREVITVHAGEFLKTVSKASITITNYIGGKYFFTVDEVITQGNIVFLIESKHTRKMKIPSAGDIKDGLLKMILYSNLSNVIADAREFVPQPILRLTSPLLRGSVTSNSSETELSNFVTVNSLTAGKRIFIQTLFNEAKSNHFTVEISEQK